MTLRDDVEGLLRGWDAHERGRGRVPIIDFDCYPGGPVTEVSDRVEVFEQLQPLRERAVADGDSWVLARVEADFAYVSAKLGERTDLDTYVRRTQGRDATGWPSEYIERRRVEAIEALAGVGVGWSPATNDDLEEGEGRLSPQQTADEIRRHADGLEPAVRDLVGTDAPFSLKVEEVQLDAYWAYWLDGAGDQARLRINLEHAQFTKIRARQLALHEILGHALQAASYHHQARQHDVPWVRILSVHAPQQVLLEGLAQALPYFVTPDEPDLMARTRLTHFTQLVRGELHRRINAGEPISACIAYAREQVPFWTGKVIADMLSDRANNSQLRPDDLAALAETTSERR